MSSFKKRLFTGALLVLVMTICILVSKYTFFLFFAALIMLSLWEFYSIFESIGKSPQKIAGIVVGVLVFVIMFLQANGYDYNEFLLLSVSILGTVFLFINELRRKSDSPFENIGITLLGILYIALPISLLWPIAYRENIYEYNSHIIIGYFIIIWVYDSMAYMTGKRFGKRRLLERVSPKKSWEGAIGGYVFALLVSYSLSVYFTELTLIQWLVVGTLVSVFGTIGDLTESMFKRSVNIKDSGNLLPGHGGLLDRFDALFLAVPVVYLYLQFV